MTFKEKYSFKMKHDTYEVKLNIRSTVLVGVQFTYTFGIWYLHRVQHEPQSTVFCDRENRKKSRDLARSYVRMFI